MGENLPSTIELSVDRRQGWQRRYALLLAEGRPQVKAYVDSMSDHVRQRMIEEQWPDSKTAYKAMKWTRHPNVVKWRAHYEQMIEEDEKLGRAQHMHMLRIIRDEAMRRNDLAVALRAEESRGKVAGHQVNRHAIEIKDEREIDMELRLLIQQHPDLVGELAKLEGKEPHLLPEVVEGEFSVADSEKALDSGAAWGEDEDEH